MLAAAERWGGGEDERPYLPRAFSIARWRDGEAQFLLEDVGPGTRRLCELRARASGCGCSGRSGAASRGRPTAGAALARRRRRRHRAARILRSSQDAARGGHRRADGPARLSRPRARAPARAARGRALASDDGSVGHHGLVTELLERELDEDAARASSTRAGPRRCSRPCARSAPRAGCPPSSRSRRRWRAASAPASAASCRRATGGYLRVCVDGPGASTPRELDARRGARRSARVSVEFCGLELAHPVINGSGTFDAIAARAAFGEGARGGLPVRRLRLQDDHAASRARATRRRGCGSSARPDQLDRPAQQGPRALPRRGPAGARAATHARPDGGEPRTRCRSSRT